MPHQDPITNKAVGIIMSKRQMADTEAFNTLRMAARSMNTSIQDAANIVVTAENITNSK